MAQVRRIVDYHNPESKEQLLRRVTYVETIDINDAFYEEDVKDLAKMLEIEVEG